MASSENALEWVQKDKRRFLHAVYRVGDLDRTIKYNSVPYKFFFYNCSAYYNLYIPFSYMVSTLKIGFILSALA
jgi:hypothetical protein